MNELIGRERERAELAEALSATRDGRGGLILLTGEAGVGKTRLAETVLQESGLFVINVSLNQEATPPYAPIATALRAYLHAHSKPNAFAKCGPLATYIALLLPELGSPPTGGDRATLFESVRCAFEVIARRQPTVMLFDDLQWADNATLELLPALADSFAKEPLLLLGIYRSDEIPRGHPLRRLRTELRRKGYLREISIEPLDRAETVELAARVLGAPPGLFLAATLYDRTQGVPFFVEELAAALVSGGRVRSDKTGIELVGSDNLPIPDTVRDTVLLRAGSLSPEARQALEVAAVAGVRFDLDLVTALTGDEAGLSEATEQGLLVEVDSTHAAFRHTLSREAIYGDISWSRRRSLHRQMAARLEGHNGPLSIIAEHWRAGHDLTRAREAFILSAEKSCMIHAYRDAALAAREALEMWPEGQDETRRLDVLDRLGTCAQLNGDLAEAERAWQEVVEGRRQSENWPLFAEAQRHLATVYELKSAWEQALEARRAAAEAFTRSHMPGEAAAEYLAAATHLRSAGRFRAALELLGQAREQANRAGRQDLTARILGLEGNVRARMGETDAGLASARSGLALALEHNLVGAAAEIYQRLADSLEHAGDYEGAKSTYDAAFDFCRTNAAPAIGQVCRACLAVVLRQTGEWERAVDVCREVLASPDSPAHAIAVGYTILGLIDALRGANATRRARPLLLEGLTVSRRIELAACEIIAIWGLAIVDENTGASESALEQLRALLARWQQVEDRHYGISPLRWAATHLARLNAQLDMHACVNALATIASTTGQPEALSALAHALGEVALLNGDAEQAAAQFTQSLELLRNVEAPLERAETQLRAGVALIAAGQRTPGLERLADAHHAARRLKAQPLAEQAARELAAHGEKVDKRLGRKAARELEHGSLTRRELQVLRHIALGRTNREIAQDLFLSPRTVDMFVRNILTKLDCNSRVEAARKADALGLLK